MQVLVPMGERVVTLDIGIPRWQIPSFAPTRGQVEVARKKRGPYGVDAAVTVTIPEIGKAR